MIRSLVEEKKLEKMKLESDSKMISLLEENIVLIEELRYVQGTKVVLEENKLSNSKIQMHNNEMTSYDAKTYVIYILVVVTLSLVFCIMLK